MNSNSNRQNQALAILTIGTAALGVGLFRVEFVVGPALSNLWLYAWLDTPFPVSDFFAVVKLTCATLVIWHYLALFGGVRRIMLKNNYKRVTGRQLADGPLWQLGLEIWFLMIVFVIDIFQQPGTRT